MAASDGTTRGAGVAPAVTWASQIPAYCSPAPLPLMTSVQVRPPPDTVIVTVPVEPSEETRATSSDPAGGVKAAEVIVVAVSVSATAGDDASRDGAVPVTAGRISSAAQDPLKESGEPQVNAVPETGAPPPDPVAAVV